IMRHYNTSESGRSAGILPIVRRTSDCKDARKGNPVLIFAHRALARLVSTITVTCLIVPASSSPTSKPPKSEHPTPGSIAQPSSPVESRHLERGEILARSALAYRGARYRMGGLGPNGYDCSGLMLTIYKKWGLLLPRTSTEQFTAGTPVAKTDLKPG